jgi:hypothetical protein
MGGMADSPVVEATYAVKGGHLTPHGFAVLTLRWARSSWISRSNR